MGVSLPWTTVEYELELGEGGKWECQRCSERKGIIITINPPRRSGLSGLSGLSDRYSYLFTVYRSPDKRHEPMKSPSCRPAALLVLVLLIASVPVIPRFSLSRCVLTRLHANRRQLCCLGATSPLRFFSTPSLPPTLSLSFSLRTTTLCLLSAECSVQSSPRASSRVAACAPAADERRKELETLPAVSRHRRH
jgi:hypothetical protein